MIAGFFDSLPGSRKDMSGNYKHDYRKGTEYFNWVDNRYHQ